MKKKNSKTRTEKFSNILTKSNRSPLKIEGDRVSKWYNSNFQNLLKNKNIEFYSSFIDRSPSVAEKVIGTINSLLKKPVFEKGNADWLKGLPSGIKQGNKTIHRSFKMNLFQASKKNKRKRSL